MKLMTFHIILFQLLHQRRSRDRYKFCTGKEEETQCFFLFGREERSERMRRRKDKGKTKSREKEWIRKSGREMARKDYGGRTDSVNLKESRITV